MKYWLILRLAPWLVARVYVLWVLLTRYRVWFMEPVWELKGQGKRFAFALWHDEMFSFVRLRKGFDLVTVVSQSKDGEFLARTLGALGVASARGSSSRGGVKALIGACRLMRKESRDAVVTVDGPRGPRRQAKEGLIFLARQAPALITPVRAFISSKKVFDKSWDKFQVPLPGAKIIVAFGEPYEIEPGELTPERLERERLRLQVAMEGIEDTVRERLSIKERSKFGL